MIAHVVLFRPRADLDDDARRGLADSFSTVLQRVGSLKRVRLGRRRLFGHGYEQLITENYTHVAIMEFEDAAGLQAYLAHPAHAEMASRFFACFEHALMYDFELGEGRDALDALMADEEQRARP